MSDFYNKLNVEILKEPNKEQLNKLITNKVILDNWQISPFSETIFNRCIYMFTDTIKKDDIMNHNDIHNICSIYTKVSYQHQEQQIKKKLS